MRIEPLRRLVVAAVTAAAIAVSTPACVIRGGAVWVTDVEPPPPRVEVVTARSGYVWIHGHWEYVSGRWVWRDGYWERERAGHVWVPGAWVHVEGRWHWRAGRWDRHHPAPARPETPRPRVRDHR